MRQTHFSRTWLVVGWLVVFSLGCDSEHVPTESPSVSESMPEETRVLVPPMLREVSAEVGLDFVHVTGRDGSFFFPEIMMGGGAFLDYDQDGDLDIYLVNGNYQYDLQEGPGPGPATNRLFRQESNGHFVDVTETSGLGDEGYGTGVGVGDVNNDGYPDVYITNYGPDQLYLNRGDGTFQNITQEARIDSPHWGASACFVDYDRDGWLDLYVTNYVEYSRKARCTRLGRVDYCSPGSFPGVPDKLYHNLTGSQAEDPRQVVFQDVSEPSGITRRLQPGVDFSPSDQFAGFASGPTGGGGLGVAVADINGDDWPDIFVTNDVGANYLWVNQKDGTFRDQAILLGCAFDGRGRLQGNMGIAVDDIDGNGTEDFFITHFANEPNALYMNDSTAGFREEALDRGLGMPSVPYTGFGTAFVDLEHDGDLDLPVVNGRVVLPDANPRYPRVRDVGGMNAFWKVFAEPRLLFLNDGTGNFTSVASPQDDFLTTLSVSRALCAGDVDNDGDVDFLVVNAASRAELYKNDAEKKGNWLMVRAIEPTCGGRDAYDAVITLKSANRTWKRVVRAAASYCASHDPRVHFGLGPLPQVDQIEVRWPNGDRERFPGCQTDQLLTLRHGDGEQ